MLGWSADDELPKPDHRTKYQRAVELAAKGWTPLGHTDPTPGWLRPTIDLEVDRIAADIKRAADRYSIKQPTKIVTGISDQQWLDAIENYAMPSRHFIGLDPANINERSKPVGLTTHHKYTDNDGDTIEAFEASSWAREDALALLKATDNESGESASVYVSSANSIPLALNVLGHDRPEAGTMVQATVGHSSAAFSGTYITGNDKRAALLAEAIARLLAIDAYDQRLAERKAEEEAAAKREAEHKKRVDAKEFARKKLLDLTMTVADFGATPDRADELIAAAKDYKAAVAAVGAPS